MLAVPAALARAAGGLPPPVVTAPGQATALAAAGPWVAVASACDVRAVAVGGKPRLLKRFGFCREDRLDSGVIGLWLGRRTIVEEIVISPSPHGEGYQLWSGPLPGGPLHQLGSDWGWSDSDQPPAYGCDWSIAAGGGVVALVRVPNNLGQGGQACLGAKTSRIVLVGGVHRNVTFAGTWSVLATDGKRTALAALDASGGRTGTLAMIGVDGKRFAAPKFTATDVKSAFQGWLTPKGLVLDSKRGLVGPGSKLLARGGSAETIGEGRILYLRGRTIRVRRLRGGPDRRLLKLPTGEAELAAGSFGLAVMTGTIGDRTTVYRIPWHTIDRTLTR